MIGPIYDDVYHVLNACTMLQETVGYRIGISALLCWSGESLLVARSISLLAGVLSAYLALRIYQRKFSSLWILAIAFHPVVLFPVFYASQVSTALTTLWAFCFSYLLIQVLENSKSRVVKIMMLAVLCPIGSMLRVEAPVYLVFVLLPWLLTSSSKHRYKLLFGSLTVLLVAALIPSTYFIYHENILSSVLSLVRGHTAAPGYSSVHSQGYYPLKSHFFVQIYATLRYLLNFVWPFTASFFGPWNHWWLIHDNRLYQFILILVPIVLLLFRKRAFPVIIFLFICYGCSIIPRLDWYAISREYLASIVFFALLVGYVPNNKQALFSKLALVYSLVAATYTYTMQYNSYHGFYKFEANLTKSSNPLVFITIAEQEFFYGDIDSAKANYKHARSLIPLSTFSRSRSGKRYWELATYGLYQTDKRKENFKKAARYAKELLELKTYLSTAVCLQEPTIPLEKCKKHKRKKPFCDFYNSAHFRPDFGYYSLRIDPDEFCENFM